MTSYPISLPDECGVRIFSLGMSAYRGCQSRIGGAKHDKIKGKPKSCRYISSSDGIYQDIYE